MFGRLLVAIYRVDLDRQPLEVTAALATACGAVVRVLHVREGDCTHGLRYLETSDEAYDVVDEAVFYLRMAGVGASGQVVRAPVGRVADAIDQEARAHGALRPLFLGPAVRQCFRGGSWEGGSGTALTGSLPCPCSVFRIVAPS